jgi:hypothetical protein
MPLMWACRWADHTKPKGEKVGEKKVVEIK